MLQHATRDWAQILARCTFVHLICPIGYIKLHP